MLFCRIGNTFSLELTVNEKLDMMEAEGSDSEWKRTAGSQREGKRHMKRELRIACLEDEEEQAWYLKMVLEAYREEKGIGYALACFRSAEEFLFAHDRSASDMSVRPGYGNSPFPYDLLILDIYMGQEGQTGYGRTEEMTDGRKTECGTAEEGHAARRMNGMELAKRIRRADKDIAIVFLSNLREYVFQGYEVNAVRYLMKPVTKEALFPVLDLLRERKREEPAWLVLPVAGEHRRMELSQILYLEAVGHYVRLHQSSGETLEWKQSFSAVLEELPAEAFVRIHRSFCVNLMHVSRLTRKSCFLDEGMELPLSRSAYQEANEAFLRYYRKRDPFC